MSFFLRFYEFLVLIELHFCYDRSWVRLHGERFSEKMDESVQFWTRQTRFTLLCMMNSSNCWLILCPRYFVFEEEKHGNHDPTLSFKVFEKALNSALNKLQKCVKISKLTESQSRSAFNFLSGNDTFVSLQTGHGKSLIYQICLMIAKELASMETMDNRFPSDPMLIVISPLNSLTEDQIISCERMGLKACKVELETTATKKHATTSCCTQVQRYLKVKMWGKCCRNTVIVSLVLWSTNHTVSWNGNVTVYFMITIG